MKNQHMTFGGWMPEFRNDILQLKRNHRLIHSISLFHYMIRKDGAVKRANKRENPGLIRWAQRHGVLVYATIGGTPPPLPAGITGGAGDRCISEIVKLCERFGFDGFDIDFEAMPVAGRDPYTLFIANLVSALHSLKRPRLVSSTIQDVPSEKDEKTTAFDYHVLGRLADHVRVMFYDYSWKNPGPIMPRGYFAEELGYARSRIPAEKFIAALPWYGRDWVPAETKHHDIVWMQRERETRLAGMEDLRERFGVCPRWREPEGEYTFTYERDGKHHEVWMPDPRKFAWMVREVRRAGASGIYVWHLAHASKAHWRAVRDVVRR